MRPSSATRRRVAAEVPSAAGHAGATEAIDAATEIAGVADRCRTCALNSGQLARQLMLERAGLPALEAVTLRCGSPVRRSRRSRSRGSGHGCPGSDRAISTACAGRHVARDPPQRRTVHLVAAADVLAWRGRHNAMLRQRVLGVYRRELAGVDLDELAAAGRAVLADGEPRSMAELARAVADRWPEPGTRPLGEMLVAGVLPMVQLPPRGVWRTKAGVRNALVSSWLGREVDPLPPDDGSDPVGQELSTALPRGVRARRHRRRTRLVRAGRAAGRGRRAPRGAGHLPRRARPGTAGPARRAAPGSRNPGARTVLAGLRQCDPRLRRPHPDHRRRRPGPVGRRHPGRPGRRPSSATWDVETEAGADARRNTVAVTPLRPFSRAERTAVGEEARELAGFLSDGESHRVRVDSSA
ncbi:Winged helix DNA-binding domain-containing protein OS=Streptomyces microflavus OX=1919 GN=G3I39_23640 PE=4 SV=1 [Streptomyces microflavus]